MSEPASDTTPPAVAPHPFNQSSADLTLRTPDRVDFHVHSPILAQASPVFADMLSLPQPPASSRDANTALERPVVDVTEDNKSLGRLLCLCYPIAKERLEDVEDIVPVLQAAMKYDMEWPISLLTTDLRAMLLSAPLKVWAVACRCRLDALAQEAAFAIVNNASGRSDSEARRRVQARRRRSTTPPLERLSSMLQAHGKEILRGVSAGDYFRLREYLRAGDENAATRVLSPTTDIPAAPIHEPPPQSPSLTSLIPSFPPPDVVLRCSNGTEYQVHTLCLILHSPTLAERIRAANVSPNSDPPNRADDANSPLLSLEVDVDSSTLSILLAVMYGGDSQLPSDLHLLGSTLVEAARLGIAKVEEAAQERWISLATSNPLEAYFVAIARGLADSARFAARKLLGRPQAIAGAYVRAMEASTALAYHHLLEYHRACASSIDRCMVTAVMRWNEDLRAVLLNNRLQDDASDSLYHVSTNIQPFLLRSAPTTNGDVPGQDWRFDLTLPALLRESSLMLPSSSATLYKDFTRVLTHISLELPQVRAGAIEEVQLEIQ